jgi:hypothetical protein
MGLGNGSRLGVPVGTFPSLLLRELGILLRGQHVPRERELSGCASRPLPSQLLRELAAFERATCASGTGSVWVCQSAAFPSQLLRELGDIDADLSAFVGIAPRGATALGMAAVWACSASCLLLTNPTDRPISRCPS